jgi:hypothetical protein
LRDFWAASRNVSEGAHQNITYPKFPTVLGEGLKNLKKRARIFPLLQENMRMIYYFDPSCFSKLFRKRSHTYLDKNHHTTGPTKKTNMTTTFVTVPTSALYDLYSPFQYQWSSINFFLAIWLLSGLFRQALLYTKKLDINNSFYSLDEDKKRNVITYIMEVLLTTLAFILQIYGSLDILFRNEDSTSQTRYDWMVFSIQVIAVLYVWELCYREKIGWPLLVHHLVTLLLIQLATASYFDTNNIVWIRFAILLGFYATTEQISFVALFFFRLNLYPEWHGILFYAAAAQAFVLKTIVTIAAIGYTIVSFYVSDDLDDDTTNWKWFWRICFLPLLLVLYASQLYACKILYALGSRCSKANAALLLGSKATSEGVEEVQRRESAAFRKHSSRLLDGFENNTDMSAERDSNLRASRSFKQNAFSGTFIGAEDFASDLNQLDPTDPVTVEEQGDVGDDV